MGLRFNRRIRLFPGVRLNLSKSGVSTSIGRPGAWLTFGKRGTRATIGVPGSGLSYSVTSKPHEDAVQTSVQGPAPSGSAARGVVWLLIFLAIIVGLAWLAIRT